MKTIKPITIALISVAILLHSCKQPQLDVTTTIEVPVGVVEVSNASIEEFINTTGTVYSMQDVTLSSEMAGEYKLQTNPTTGKPYAIGDMVKENTVLIKLEDAEYYNGLRIKSKEVDYEISKQEYEKQQSLYEKGGATLRELKNAEINLINTEYDIESSKINLEKMDVKAPFSGVISDLPYFTNRTKVKSATELVKIINYKALYLETNLPEKYFQNIEKGFKVYISSYTNALDTLLGTITQNSPDIDPEARTFMCFVEVNNSERILLPGMFVKADMVINSSENTIVIPKDLVISFNRAQMVYVVDKGVANSRFITTGLENDTEIEVTTGLETGESIVSKGFETLRDKSKVKIIRSVFNSRMML
ncbi:MAG: efflux RND transporter periplasmic adaptor subunit, partial [Bacteroidales bacterium]|nr:efflux RND transporter periplasmic adaptor subunit [Bacteroidales bacterium]